MFLKLFSIIVTLYLLLLFNFCLLYTYTVCVILLYLTFICVFFSLLFCPLKNLFVLWGENLSNFKVKIIPLWSQTSIAINNRQTITYCRTEIIGPLLLKIFRLPSALTFYYKTHFVYIILRRLCKAWRISNEHIHFRSLINIVIQYCCVREYYLYKYILTIKYYFLNVIPKKGFP